MHRASWVSLIAVRRAPPARQRSVIGAPPYAYAPTAGARERPRAASSATASVSSPDQTRTGVSMARTTTSAMAPGPNWSVASRGRSDTTCSAMARSAGPASIGAGAVIGRRAVTVRVISHVIGGAPMSSASSSTSITTCVGDGRGGGRPTHGPPVHELRATAHGRDHEDIGPQHGQRMRHCGQSGREVAQPPVGDGCAQRVAAHQRPAPDRSVEPLTVLRHPAEDHMTTALLQTPPVRSPRNRGRLHRRRSEVASPVSVPRTAPGAVLGRRRGLRPCRRWC